MSISKPRALGSRRDPPGGGNVSASWTRDQNHERQRSIASQIRAKPPHFGDVLLLRYSLFPRNGTLIRRMISLLKEKKVRS
jgi:hypothetical protein